MSGSTEVGISAGPAGKERRLATFDPAPGRPEPTPDAFRRNSREKNWQEGTKMTLRRMAMAWALALPLAVAAGVAGEPGGPDGLTPPHGAGRAAPRATKGMA